MTDTPTTDQPTLAVTLDKRYPEAYDLMLRFYCDPAFYNSNPECRPADNVLMAIEYALRHRTHSEPRPVAGLREAAQFLSDRLDDLEWMDGELESTLRDYMGHVDPAHARLRTLLDADPTSLEGGEGLREALEAQMETQDENLPSSMAREQGLVWLEGWFNLVEAAAHPSTQLRPVAISEPRDDSRERPATPSTQGV